MSNILKEHKNVDNFQREQDSTCLNILNTSDKKEIEEGLFGYANVADFVFYIFNATDYKYKMHYVYEKEKEKVYISIELFLFKIVALIEKKERKLFVKRMKPQGTEKDFFNISILEEYIKKINTSLGIKYGCKNFYHNQDKKIIYIDKIVRSVDEELETFYKGRFLQFNLKGGVGVTLVEENYMEKFDSSMNHFVDSADEGKTIERLLIVNLMRKKRI